ncbi:preprotein translocase subunit Sec61beta [Candidatus Pacearchaeota archaeon]|nr:preprotein translocase subunit Sec61beta [Candidatus Pacearchaeota archaeon]
MADNILMPSGSGGLLRYNEEYPSKLRITPQQVVILIVAVVIAMTAIKIFL